MEPVLKQINYDTFTVDFVEKDGSTHIHFYRTNKEDLLDAQITKNFPYKIKETGKDIEQELLLFAPEIESLRYDKNTLLESRDRRNEFKFMTDREKEVQEKYKELEHKYKDRSVIHKAVTEKLLTGKLTEQVFTYIVPEINPFIDTIMLKLAEELDMNLQKS